MNSPTKSPPFSIVAHSHLRWDFVWQRPQQVFSRLAKHHSVLFVEEPIYQPGNPHLRLLEVAPNIVRAIPVLPAPCGARPTLRDRAAAAAPGAALAAAGAMVLFADVRAGHGRQAGRDRGGVRLHGRARQLPLRARPTSVRANSSCSSTPTWCSPAASACTRRNRASTANVHFFGCGVDAEHFGKARAPDTVVPSDGGEPAAAGARLLRRDRRAPRLRADRRARRRLLRRRGGDGRSGRQSAAGGAARASRTSTGWDSKPTRPCRRW